MIRPRSGKRAGAVGIVIRQGAVLLAAGAILTVAAAAQGAAAAREQPVAPQVRAELRAASARYHESTRVAGPLAGSVRLAANGPVQWAIATFSVPGIGLVGQPELLRRRPGERWLDLGEVGPKLCGTPPAVLRAWNLQKRSRGCVSPLGGRTPPPLSD
jgi:hypothetical protein